LEILLQKRKYSYCLKAIEVGFFRHCGVLKYKKPSISTWFKYDIFRHTPIYFLTSCSSAELVSAFIGFAKIRKLDSILEKKLLKKIIENKYL
jgi:hypothetical protein